MAEITEKIAMKLWKDCFGDEKFASDCFGTWMCRDGWGNDEYFTKRPGGDGKEHDYSWNVDHIRPKSNFKDEKDANFWGNFEPMSRGHNEEKSDKYPGFSIDGYQYTVVKDGYGGYGIEDSNGNRIDQKAIKGFYYE